jgi:hypothetical protein
MSRPDPTPAGRAPRLLLGGAWLVVLAYAIIYTWMTAWSYARIAFTTDAQEQATSLSNCATSPGCAPDAAAHLSAQLSAMDHVVTVVRGTAVLITVADLVLVVIATIAVLAARPHGAGRVLGFAWVVQAAVTGALFVLYLVLLLRGHAVLGDIPRPAWMPTFDAAFGTPFDAGTIYYAVWFVVMNGAVILVLRSLGRALRALTTPAPGSAAPAR